MAKSMMEDCMEDGGDDKSKCNAPKVSSNKKKISKPKQKKGNPMRFTEKKYPIPTKNPPKPPKEQQDSTWGSHQNVRYL